MDMTIDTPQNSTDSVSPLAQQELRLQLSLETMLYVVILVIAVVIRVLQLGDLPLDSNQAHEALSALRRVDSNVAGGSLTANYPLMAFVNEINFIFFGQGNFVPRIGTALVGVCLAMGPMLWRRDLGRVMTLAFTFLLAVSPVAVTSARSMGGVTWTMALVFIAGWLILRFRDTEQRSYATAATVMIGMMLFLAEPTGIVTVLGVAFGLALAVWTSPPDPDRVRVRDMLRYWPLAEGLIATLGVILVVGTGFFTSSGILDSIGTTFIGFVDGLSSRPSDLPLAYAFLVALRYEFGIVLLGIITLWLVLKDERFILRFLGGWLIFGLFASLIYANPSPDVALWLVIPATGLTAYLITVILQPASSGYWSYYIPNWGVPFHALITAVLLVAIGINGVILGRATQQEAQAIGIERIESLYQTSGAKLGAIDARFPLTTMQLTVVPEKDETTEIDLTVQVVPITKNFIPQLTITDSAGEVLFGPFTYKQGESRGIVEDMSLIVGQDYFFKVTTADGQPVEETNQFMLLTYRGKQNDVPGIYLRIPTLMLLTRVSPTALRQQPMVFIPFMILIIIIIYLLASSLWGPRAAWRGLALGFLVYTVGSGLGLGWQASHTFANDPRELWQREAVAPGLTDLEGTLRELSLQASGEPNKLSITVQGEDDTALAWMLRNFEDTEFVTNVGAETTSQIVIVPKNETEITLGDDYIGQDFALSQSWDLFTVNWTDFIAWYAVRDTRIEPVPSDTVQLWVRKDVYGVQEVVPSTP